MMVAVVEIGGGAGALDVGVDVFGPDTGRRRDTASCARPRFSSAAPRETADTPATRSLGGGSNVFDEDKEASRCMTYRIPLGVVNG